MIYIFVGADHKKRNAAVDAIVKNRERIVLSGPLVTKEIIQNFATSISLFGESPAIILDSILTEGIVSFTKDELKDLSESTAPIIFLEEKLLKPEENKYKKYADIQFFENAKEKKAPVSNVFAIADAFGRSNKVLSWVLYRDAIEKGALPEAISGMLFWKIKQMLLSSSSREETHRLKEMSGELVSLYHKSHKGECDFVIGLEQFILLALSK
jgi:hypothetical protein